MKLSIALILCIIACIHPVLSNVATSEAGNQALSDDELLVEVEKKVESLKTDPARELKLDEILKTFSVDSTPGQTTKEQRKKKKRGTRLIRRLIKRAKRAKSALGKKAQALSSTFLEKFKSTAAKVKILFKLTIYRYSKLRFRIPRR
jgi:predicted DNA binding CopG/RHH family protein